ncbi:DUF3709 domain-containing protein, partial [Vibrio paracholerae]|nr:DUF3709 domain-containing protein [Vibrio paracholerae]
MKRQSVCRCKFQ